MFSATTMQRIWHMDSEHDTCDSMEQNKDRVFPLTFSTEFTIKSNPVLYYARSYQEQILESVPLHADWPNDVSDAWSAYCDYSVCVQEPESSKSVFCYISLFYFIRCTRLTPLRHIYAYAQMWRTHTCWKLSPSLVSLSEQELGV